MIAALVALRSADVPLTAFTILGGALAIGVGFGSQALINNFISGLIMLAERPVRIGERVLFGNFDGVVEDVGFRCTKLRTGTDHLVTIPNSTLVNESIENVGRRRTIQRTLNLQITYDTPRESIAAAVDAIRDILEEPGIREPIHPVIGWEKHQPKVFFNDFNAESLNLQVVYHFAPPDQGAFNEHAQKVNFRIFEEFERLGVAFAFPSRTVYLANDLPAICGCGSRRKMRRRAALTAAATENQCQRPFLHESLGGHYSQHDRCGRQIRTARSLTGPSACRFGPPIPENASLESTLDFGRAATRPPDDHFCPPGDRHGPERYNIGALPAAILKRRLATL